MYSTPLTPVTPAPAAQASPAPQDELDALINRAVSGHAPYYTPQEVSAETTLDLPQPTEFETPLTPVPQEPKFDTPLIPVEDEPRADPCRAAAAGYDRPCAGRYDGPFSG